MSASEKAATITDHEAGQVVRANASGLAPVVFVHGLWLLPSSWDRWAEVFEAAGYVAVTPGWPGDAETAAEAREDSAALAGRSIGEVADHFAAITASLARKRGAARCCSSPGRRTTPSRGRSPTPPTSTRATTRA